MLIPCPLASRRRAPMKVKVQLVMCDDVGHPETVTDVVILEKACQRIELVRLSRAEVKGLLMALQQRVASLLVIHRHGQACG
jgi:hypothetical protein